MKIALVTEAIGDYVSGGLNYLVSLSNELKKNGHDICAFVKSPPFRSDWLRADFPIYPIDSNIWNDYNGILVCIFSPVAKEVADHRNAQDKFYIVHANEGLFKYNGPEWTQRAIDSYKLPLKIVCVSHYLQILMEQVYNRRVIGVCVPPGIDSSIFNIKNRPIHDPNKLRVVVFGRQDWIRGTSVALEGIKISKNPIELRIIPDGCRDRKMVAEIFKNSDIYIDASRLAGCPTIPKESMGCGCISLCTIYGASDYILSGWNGFLIPVDRPDIITKILDDLSEDDILNMQYRAIQTMKDHTWTHIAKRFEYAINEGLNRKNLLLEKEWK